MDKAFEKALDMVRKEFLGCIPRVLSFLRARDELNRKIGERFMHHPSGHVIWLDRYLDWKAGLAAGSWNHIYFVGFCTDGVNFSLTCTPKCPKRKRFPGDWRGLENEELEEISGISGLLFIHEGGCKANARNKEALMRLVENVLQG